MNWLTRLFGRRRETPNGEQFQAGGRTTRSSSDPSTLEIGPRQLKERSADGEVFLLDCREPHEWVLGRIPGSVHIPMNAIPHRLQELPKEEPVIVVCAHGVRSLMVAEFLQHQGFLAFSLSGGLARWHTEGGSIES